MRPKVIPPMETEVIPAAPTLPTTASSGSLIAPNSFVLPPPSPLTQIPHQPDLLSAKPLAAPAFGDANDQFDEEPSFSDDLDPQLQHQTLKRPFPVAKPHAQHMIHAYSPARPSPLSRILMMANSPAQSRSTAQDGGLNLGMNVQAEEEDHRRSGSSQAADMMLEEELALDDLTCESEESPLRAKNARMAGKNKSTAARTSGGLKSKPKTKSTTLRSSFRSAARETDKENGNVRPSTSNNPPPLFARQTIVAKPLAAGKGGARRVPIGSADAAPIGPGWK